MAFIEIKLIFVFLVYEVDDVKFPSRLRHSIYRLSKLKVLRCSKHGINCMCSCGSVTETASLALPPVSTIRLELLKIIYNPDPKMKNISNDRLLHVLKHG